MAESAGSPPAATQQRPPAAVAVDAVALGAVRTWILGRPTAEVRAHGGAGGCELVDWGQRGLQEP